MHRAAAPAQPSRLSFDPLGKKKPKAAADAGGAATAQGSAARSGTTGRAAGAAPKQAQLLTDDIQQLVEEWSQCKLSTAVQTVLTSCTTCVSCW